MKEYKSEKEFLNDYDNNVEILEKYKKKKQKER